jgi:hypothetical protein
MRPRLALPPALAGRPRLRRTIHHVDGSCAWWMNATIAADLDAWRPRTRVTS